MAFNSLYDFIIGVTIRLPAGPNVDDDDRHGVQAILTPGEKAQTLIGDHIRMLSELSCAEPNS